MPPTPKLDLTGRQTFGAAALAAVVIGLITGAQAYVARAGSPTAVPLGLAIQNRTLAALGWVLAGAGVVAAARRWPLERETWRRALPIHLMAALVAGLAVNVLLHTLLWLLGTDRVPFASLPDVIRRDTLDHAHLNLLVYAMVVATVHWVDGRKGTERGRGRESDGGSGYASRLTARRRDTFTIVPVDDVDWIEAADDYACLHVGTRRHLTDDRLHLLEQRLDPSRFVRVHRSALVNLTRVREIVDGRWGDAVAVLRDGTRVRVSRTRREVLMAALGGTRT